jgi:hypothetical protein
VLDPDVIAAALAELGEPAYRARQVYEALTRGLVTDFAAVTTLPKPLWEELAARLSPLSLMEVETQLLLTVRLGFVPQSAVERILDRTARIGKQANALMTRLNDKLRTGRRSKRTTEHVVRES